jgi:hypothetical protein
VWDAASYAIRCMLSEGELVRKSNMIDAELEFNKYKLLAARCSLKGRELVRALRRIQFKAA